MCFLTRVGARWSCSRPFFEEKIAAIRPFFEEKIAAIRPFFEEKIAAIRPFFEEKIEYNPIVLTI